MTITLATEMDAPLIVWRRQCLIAQPYFRMAPLTVFQLAGILNINLQSLKGVTTETQVLLMDAPQIAKLKQLTMGAQTP